MQSAIDQKAVMQCMTVYMKDALDMCYFHFAPQPFRNFPFPLKPFSMAWLKTNGTPIPLKGGYES